MVWVMLNGFEFDPTDKPDDPPLLQAIKRMHRGESTPTFDEHFQKIKADPPIQKWQEETVNSIGMMANEYIWLFAEHLKQANEAGDQNLELQIARQITRFYSMVVNTRIEVSKPEWVQSRTEIWHRAIDEIIATGENAFLKSSPTAPTDKRDIAPDLPPDIPGDLIPWFRRDIVKRLVREHLAEVFPDGPQDPHVFVYKGKPYPGLTDKPWRLLAHLWKQRTMKNEKGNRIRSAHFSDLSGPVLGDESLDYGTGHFNGHRTDCNKFFDKKELPFHVYSTGRNKDYDRTAVLEFRPN